MRLCDRENAARARLVIPTRIRLPFSRFMKRSRRGRNVEKTVGISVDEAKLGSFYLVPRKNRY